MSCSRTWEVEAARDGRLGEGEQKAHARHLSECEDCRREGRELDALRAGLRDLAAGEPSSSSVREGRVALLERALAERNERVRPRRSDRRPLAALAIAAALGVALWVGLRPASSSQVVVQATSGARYLREEQDGRPIIHLANGRLKITVAHAAGAPRLRVLTPDGVLEDIGTTFVVDVSLGHTELVEVSVGLVRVSLAGLPVAMVEPGHPYRPYAAAVVAARAPAPSEGSDALLDQAGSTADRTATPMTPRVRERGREARAPHQKPGHTKTSPEDAGDDTSAPAVAFSQAVRTLDRGQAADAARRFRSFAQDFPDDPRAQDAGYLRVVAWLRAGKPAEARSAAADFLRRYPNSFRRQDVERLLAP